MELGVLSSFSLALALDRLCRRPHPSEFYEWMLTGKQCDNTQHLLLCYYFYIIDTEITRRPVVAGPWLFWDWEAQNSEAPAQVTRPRQPRPFSRHGPRWLRAGRSTQVMWGAGEGRGARGPILSPAAGIWSRYSPWSSYCQETKTNAPHHCGGLETPI